MPLEYPPGWAPTPSAEQTRARYLSQLRIVAGHVEGQLPYDATVAMPVGAVVEVVRELEDRAREIRRLQASVLRSPAPATDGHAPLPRLTQEQIEGIGILLRAYAPAEPAAPGSEQPRPREFQPAWRSANKLSCAVDWVRSTASHPGFAQVAVQVLARVKEGEAPSFWVVGRRSGDRVPLFQRQFPTMPRAQQWAEALEGGRTCPDLTFAPPTHLSGSFAALLPGTHVTVDRGDDLSRLSGIILGPAIGYQDVYVVGAIGEAPSGWHASEMQVTAPSPSPFMADENP